MDKKIERRNAKNENLLANASSENNKNWAGYERAHKSSGVSGKFTIPTVNTNSSNSPARVSIWAGLGGDSSDYLAQAGAACKVYYNQTPTYYVWWEFYPFNYEQKLTAIPCSAGNKIYVSISYDDASNAINYYIANTTTNKSTSFQYTPSDLVTDVTSTAEWIVERPLNSNAFTSWYDSLANWSSSGLNFTECKYIDYNATQSTTLSDGSLIWKERMFDTSTSNSVYYLAVPGSLGTYGGFSTTWYCYK